MRRRLVAVAATLAVGVAACGGGGGGDETERKDKPEEEEVAVAPLTGLPDTDGTAATRPALTVKIDNICGPGTPCVRPQAGIDQADVV